MHRFVTGLAAAVCAVAFAAPVAPVSAQEIYDDAFVIAADTDERRKSNMVSRQEMLIERMIETACFAMIGVEQEQNWTRLEQAHTLFSLSKDALRNGNAALGLEKEKNERVLSALTEIDRYYRPFDEMIQQVIETREPNREALRQLVKKASAVEKAVARAGRAVDGIYLKRAYPMKSIVALNFIGKERVSSQKISRDYCMIVADVDAQLHRIELENEAKLFEGRLEALLNGEPLVGLPPAPTEAIAEQLRMALDLWAEMLPAIDGAMGGAEIRDADVTLVSNHATPLLAALNQTVYLYESLD